MPVETVMSIIPNEESSMQPTHPPLVKEVEELVVSALQTEPIEPNDVKGNIEDIDEASQKWYSSLSSLCRENIDIGVTAFISGSLSILSSRILDDEVKKLEPEAVVKDNNNNNKQNQSRKNQVDQHGKISNASQKKNAAKMKNTKGNSVAGSKQSKSNNNNNNQSSNNKNNNANNKNNNNNMNRNNNNNNNNNKYRKTNGPVGGNFGADHRGGDSADHRVAGMQRRWPSPDHDHRRSNSGPPAAMGHYHHGPYGPNAPPPYHMHPPGGRHQFPILPPHPPSASHYYSGPGPPPLGGALGKAGKQYHPPPHHSSESHSPGANIHPNQQHPYNPGYFDERQDHSYFDGRSGSSNMHNRGKPSGYDDRLRSRSGSRTIGRSNRRETSPSRSQSNSHYRDSGDRDREHMRFQNEFKESYGGKDGHGHNTRQSQNESRRTSDRFRSNKTESDRLRNLEQKNSSGVSRNLRDGGDTSGGGSRRHNNEGHVPADDRGKQEEGTEMSLGENESRSSSRGRKTSSRKSERRRSHRSKRRSRSPSTSDSQPRHQHSSSSRKRRRRSRSSSASSDSVESSDDSRSQKKSHRRRSERHKRSSRKHRNSTGKEDDIGSTEKSITAEGRHRRSSKESPRKRKKREKTKQLSNPREPKVPENATKEHL